MIELNYPDIQLPKYISDNKLEWKIDIVKDRQFYTLIFYISGEKVGSIDYFRDFDKPEYTWVYIDIVKILPSGRGKKLCTFMFRYLLRHLTEEGIMLIDFKIQPDKGSEAAACNCYMRAALLENMIVVDSEVDSTMTAFSNVDDVVRYCKKIKEMNEGKREMIQPVQLKGRDGRYDYFGEKGEYKDGKKVGEWIEEVDDNVWKGSYKDGERDGVWVEMYNGTKLGEHTYKDGVRHGLSQEWDEEGGIYSKGEYKNGEKVGKWIEDGEVDDIVEY